MTKKDVVYSAKLKHANPLDLIFSDGDSELTTPKNQATSIKPERIRLDPTQPRRYFERKKLEELTQSIKVVGILEPLLVRPLGNGDYELIAGERRLIAAGMADLEEVPVVIKEMDDATVKQVRLIENLQREDLNAYEETIGILELLVLRLKMSQDEVVSLLNRMEKANRKKADNVIRSDEVAIVEGVFMAFGKLSPESFRTNRLPLLNLPDEIQQALSQGKIEYTKARAIAKLKIDEDRKQLLSQAIDNNLSLVEIQQLVRNIQSKEEGNDNPPLLKYQYKELSKQLASSKVWDNPKKKKALEKLLNQIKIILEEQEESTEN
ncbi:ParB/RepB/Spo0J family partition protein [Nostoc sp. 'Lobaria pulmonaria (5183) cyanobiont']|uniref:ParB/RepB/Spo0J family partition protein n=1 Tax=Nostoc sp. 'Lobaria pulmonaria (5183) cyanobiont' TaxID=1618022 RepID=UPI000CF3353F|nr:ParB/RepB/Spo0J family partition protein [Nostoc sp. 'Lobaria pulmonaria (5183) cyanobiont']AVH71109.1 chromosome/plasmid partitioning protein ParB [Nostoc sp. 'Lobaria pulmonaria (5183) cyanobiont']